nr:DEAD/DEAH box helicase family protein [Deltaproteobacteria bacterium]
KFRPQEAPTKDPFEEIPSIGPIDAADTRERLLFQFLRDAPHLPNGKFLAGETSTVRLWPHQKATVDDILSRFPARYLLCSEVGLGKTIEAGIALRQLILEGKVKRCLILTPKSVARQWQEELYEKVNLNIPLFSANAFTDYFRNELPQKEGNPWAAHPILIASSQLAKRRERQEEVLSAGPWDLIIIDEAHHARRKDFLDDRRRPNRLLELLEGTAKLSGLASKTNGLMFLTATPMQVHPVEVWDLMKSLDLGGRWEASDENFLRFFDELRRPFERVDWNFVLNMFEDSLSTGTELDHVFARIAEEKLGPVEWEQVRHLAGSRKKSVILKQLSPDGRLFLTDMVKRHTPLRRLLKRSTRKLLYRYREQGILQDTVPTRKPKSVWVPLADDERVLYDRIEEYFSDFYQKYESERKGLGFVMTVYRRRLTSSFYAVERSLERRLAFLKGQIMPEAPQGLTEEDLEQEELSLDIGEEIDEGQKFFTNEIEYVEDFLREIRKLKGDTKWEQLHGDIKEMLKSHESLVLFTHYTDTMDYLRAQLRQVYGSQVACYSGRGGEIWNGYKWVIRSKEEIKNAFREARDIKILVCTDAASEGLNLQTCGMLINYDMPWNPMRAEQRIGRIDRIGGHPVVYVRNYFYEDTVEARVYQALSRRINMFEWVVGELQPILSGVERTIQELALTRKEERKTKIEEAIQRLNREYDDQVAKGLKLDDYLADEFRKDTEEESPLNLKDLEKIITQSHALKSYWENDSQFPNAWILKLNDEKIHLTFDRDVFDRYPETFRLLTYGEPILKILLDRVRPLIRPDEADLPLVRYAVDRPESMVCYYALTETGAIAIKTLTDLQKFLDAFPPDGRPGRKAEAQAREQLEKLIKRSEQKVLEKSQTQYRAGLLALEEQGRRLLVKAALCDISMAHEPSLFDQSPIEADFDEETVQRLRNKGYPFGPLFHLVEPEGLKPELTDPFWLR